MAKAFEKPTVEEIESFIKEKKPKWPSDFVRFYAEKFWNTYEKSGWRLSAGRGGPVKSWKACFSSNWQDIPYTCDLDKLKAMEAAESARNLKLAKEGREEPKEMNAGLAELVMVDYIRSPTRTAPARLAACYDWIKDNLKVKLTREQRDIVLRIAEEDKEKAKATVVGWVFERMANNCQTFSSLLEHA